MIRGLKPLILVSLCLSCFLLRTDMAFAQQDAIAPPNGLVSWWPGDGDANDIWGANNGTMMNGATFGPGMVSQAFSLDGVNDFINVPDGASLDITEALSIDLWMKAPPVTNYQGAEIVDKGDYAFVGGAYTLRISAIYSGDIPNAGPNLAGRVNFAIWIGEPSTYPNDTWHINSQSRVDDDAWHFVAATYDGAAMKLYVDGVLETTFSVSGNIRPTDLDLRLGCNSYTGGGCFRGLVDEVEIFDRGLSAGEVEALYSAGSAGKIKSGWRSSYIVPEGYPIADFGVYGSKLYAAANSKLYAYDQNSWNVVDAPTFVTSLEPYGGKLVVGGQGGLYCYDGTSFSLVFSVPTYIRVLGAYNNTLYAGTMLANPPELYYCNDSAENPANWHLDTDFATIRDFSGPFGSIDSFTVYNNAMYVGSGGTLYSFSGTDWSIAASYDDVYAFVDMQVYNGKLYLATRDQGWRKPLYQGGTGFSGRVIEFDGENWTTVLDHDYWIYSLEEYDGKLYAGTANKILTYNGTSWETSFSATEGAYYAISMITYDGKIYAGMGNGYVFADPAPAKANPETIVVPEFPSITILAVFMALAILAVALARKNRFRRFS